MKNPWEVQARMMEISGQISSDYAGRRDGPTLLYAALIMEEFSETLAALRDLVVAVDKDGNGGASPDDDQERSTAVARDLLLSASRTLASYSQSIRHLIKWTSHDGNKFVLKEGLDASVVELADGLADTAVTLFGMCVASGLPIDECYTEVQRSNLSKANPATGVVDKDLSGKWIKGPLYTPPNLAHILGLKE